MRLLRTFIFVSALSFGTTALGQDTGWTNLLDVNLTHWDVFMGVPHHSIQGLEGVEKGNGIEGTPLGLNNDPLKVFSTKVIAGDTLLYITGQVYGGLTSKKTYENYHLKVDFKWGTKKWEPRLNAKRDNGILYHCNGPHGAFWNVWMQSQEFQVQEGDMGDYFGLAGGVNTIKASKNEAGFYEYDADAEPILLGTVIEGKNRYRCVRAQNHEKPNGEWNTLEVVCFNGKSWHIVNGHIVMVLDRAAKKTEQGVEPINKGKIQLQSEAAEAYYRNIRIKELGILPDFLR